MIALVLVALAVIAAIRWFVAGAIAEMAAVHAQIDAPEGEEAMTR